jgi:hypothetical protein
MRRPGWLPRDWPLLSFLIGVLVAVTAIAIAVIPPLPGSTTVPPAAESCRAVDPAAADPAAPHGLFVVSPPAAGPDSDNGVTQQYLLNNPAVCGAVFFVTWSSVDQGPNATPRYDWSAVDLEIQPWAAAGKEVNLVFWGVAYSAGPSATPSYVLSQTPTVQCAQPNGTESAVTPIYWQGPYRADYEAFVSAAVVHFDSNPAVGYLRFGVGTGGEDIVVPNANAPACLSQLDSFGYTAPLWLNYTFSILDYERSLHSSKQLMTSINFIPDATTAAPDAVAALAVKDGIGFGYQGARSGDITSYQAGQSCGADWCALFGQYSGEVPLELQFVDTNTTNGPGQPGALASLLPFAISLHTQCLEIGLSDWLATYDPDAPGYLQDHAAYSTAFLTALETVGTA